MIPSHTWREIIEESNDYIKTEKLYPRPNYVNPLKEEANNKRFVSILLGVRRSGKSRILHLLAKELGLDKTAYINFEDERLLSTEISDLTNLTKLLDGYKYLMLDEIQNIIGWEKWINRLVEKEKFKILISGSNSSLLAGEYSISLVGRKLTTYVFPFSYKEIKRFKNISLEDYLIHGGFPEPVISERYELLRDYRYDILYRDIMKRHVIKEHVEMEKLFFHLLDNPGILVSKKRIGSVFHLSHVTLKRFLSLIQESFALFQLKKSSMSSYEVEKSSPKIYPIDNGLVNKKQSLGILFESVIAQELIRLASKKGVKIHFYKDEKSEVDFIIGDIAIQACYELHRKNIKREAKGLIQYPARKKIIISHLGYEYVDIPDDIDIVSSNDFLLEPEKFLTI